MDTYNLGKACKQSSPCLKLKQKVTFAWKNMDLLASWKSYMWNAEVLEYLLNNYNLKQVCHNKSWTIYLFFDSWDSCDKTTFSKIKKEEMCVISFNINLEY